MLLITYIYMKSLHFFGIEIILKNPRIKKKYYEFSNRPAPQRPALMG